MSEQTDKCANPGCTCPAQMDRGYCGDYCERARHDSEVTCECSHAECELAPTVTF